MAVLAPFDDLNPSQSRRNVPCAIEQSQTAISALSRFRGPSLPSFLFVRCGGCIFRSQLLLIKSYIPTFAFHLNLAFFSVLRVVFILLVCTFACCTGGMFASTGPRVVSPGRHFRRGKGVRGGGGGLVLT